MICNEMKSDLHQCGITNGQAFFRSPERIAFATLDYDVQIKSSAVPSDE